MTRTPLRTVVAALLAVPGLLAGCTSITGDVNEDGFVDCRDLDGTFTADSLSFVGVDDPGAFEDFGGGPDFAVAFAGDTFESQLATGEGILSSGGTFVSDDFQLELSAPLVPGQGLGSEVLDCNFDGGMLQLFGETEFDFDDDPFDAPVPAQLEGTFTWLGPFDDDDDD